MADAVQAGRELDALVAKALGWTDVAQGRWPPREWWTGLPPDGGGRRWIEQYSTQLTFAWDVFEAGLAATGSASIAADMEDYGRGAVLGHGPARDVWVQIGDHRAFGPVALAICRAFLAAAAK